MKKIGFIGLGTMGGPMAANLLAKGYEVTVYNRSADKAKPLAEQGAKVASSPAETAKGVDVLFTMISDDRAIEEVYFGENGVCAGIGDGGAAKTVIDSSTISPELVRRIAEALAARGVEFLDAPVTGSKPAALDGTLVFMAGGKEETVRRHEELLLAMGRKVLYMGPSGSGAITKLAHNAIVGINNVALAEGFSIAAKAGIDTSAFLDLVMSGGAGSKAAELKGRKIIEHDFSNQFSLNLMLKDMKLASRLSDQMSVPVPMLEAAKSMFQIGQTQGYGEEDLSAVARCYEDWIGRRIGKTGN
ncbi:NAD(P)-dependent oxidoreductase [Paenibacillus sp. MSJ-34]|uniref:NAD(P)-dependent oxidoreductase n=1 Tax=Paenibacillus sp. MSJ-34 TaxID=2841529 RepID=UPI001C0FEB41|nr:NAD(P)-dependent oxidoreductase [Paenibacillus sp. MSJ-34]MBU5440735.1 NAD(P)-dependent oxidoreductase [Paenibacillus sp. MSJ-34]